MTRAYMLASNAGVWYFLALIAFAARRPVQRLWLEVYARLWRRGWVK